jgi:Lantibiotic dehydratase, N terminus
MERLGCGLRGARLESQVYTTVAREPEAPAVEAAHRVGLPGERWSVWRWLCLRGAGFPIAGALDLGDSACGAAADEVLAAETAAAELRAAAVEALRRDLAGCPADERNRRIKRIGRLKKGLLPAGPEPEIAALGAALQETAAARERYAATFSAALDRQSRHLRRAAADPRLREAVTWQNRDALLSGFDPLLRQDAARRGSHERRNEQLVASYLYRYCTKNDTIGFFGPVGWARMTDVDEAIVARPGPGLIARRQAFFETWCIDAVAEALTLGKPLKPWLSPRQLPFFLLQGDLFIPFAGKPFQLSPEERAVFAACTGRETARELAARLVSERGLGSEAEVFAVLESFVARGMIVWEMELPMRLDADQILARKLGKIEEPALCEPLLAELAELVRLRDETTAAAGDAVRLGAALDALEERFHGLTGKAVHRLHGMTYAGRDLVYEDCRRDLELEFGARFRAALGPPLSLVLQSARWLGEEIGRRFQDELRQAFAEVSARTGSATVGLLQFLRQIKPWLLVNTSNFVTAATDEHRRRWAEILDLPPGARRVERTSAALRPRVEAAFPALGPGWSRARQHSPDLLVRAASLEAIRRGDFQIVLGELHFASNTLNAASFLSQHPCPEDLRQAMRSDIPGPTVSPCLPKRREGEPPRNPIGFEVPGTSARLGFSLLSEKDLCLALDRDPPAETEATILFPGELVVTERDGELWVATRDGRHRLDIVNFFEVVFSAQSVNSFRILPRGAHLPRVAIDRLVVQREMWRIPLRETSLPGETSEEGRFLAARRMQHRYGLPRFVFARSEFESKPFFVDFTSPVAVEILARACRRAVEKGGDDVEIGISEMLPEPDQQWLPDAEGRRYTCELRLVAVDGMAFNESRGGRS